LIAALAVGVMIGFVVAKVIIGGKSGDAGVNKLAACGVVNPNLAMKAADDLISAQDAINAGDRVRAENLALRAQAASASAKGHYMLGQLRMADGDTVAALDHYHCVVLLEPTGREAKALGERLNPLPR
jgi:hypothetical protein